MKCNVVNSSAFRLIRASANIWAVNAALSSAAHVNAQFITLTNLHDQSNSNCYRPSRASFGLPSNYALQETDLRAPSTGAEQSRGALFLSRSSYNPASSPCMPFLSQSTPGGMAINQTAEASTAPPVPSSMSKRSNERSPNLHGPIQHSEPKTCQERTQSFFSRAQHLQGTYSIIFLKCRARSSCQIRPPRCLQVQVR